MNYYRCCGGSEKVTIDGEKVKDKLELTSLNANNLVLNKDNRVRFYVNQVVVYNDVFYVLIEKGLYKSKTGTKWELEAAYPLQTPYVGWKAVVYNDEIHFFCRTYHYKWDGTTWTSVSTLPYYFQSGSVVVYNNDIHILGGSSAPTSHYKWDGTTWTSVSTLPYSFTGAAVVFRNEIRILGGFWGGSGYNYHYKWDGTTWTSVSTLPYSGEVLAVVLDDKIHILGGAESGDYNQYSNCNKHFEYDGSWTMLDDIVVTVTRSMRIYISGVHGGSAFVYNNKIYVAGHSNDSNAIGYFLAYTCRIINNTKVYCQ